MGRIAYVDHSYHQQTLSTGFIPQIFIRYGHTVDCFWDESWCGGSAVPWKAVSKYDAVIMFQSFCPIKAGYFRLLHPNVTYIPMLDQFGACIGPLAHLSRFWEPFQGSKVLNFSYSAHVMTVGFGIRSLYARYYQPPLPRPTAPPDGLHGFFWLRDEEQIPWRTVHTLIGRTSFDSLHIHMAADPGSSKPTLPSDDDIRRFKITMSSWLDNKKDYINKLERTNVFFAPRAEEGIGQSFLEAFSRGQCVVAADSGTMNEYILHGVNGLLFNRDDPRPLNFNRAVELGRMGWQAAREGYARWEMAQERIVDFILTPSKDAYLGKYDHFNRLPNLFRNMPWPTSTERSHGKLFVSRLRSVWCHLRSILHILRNRN